MRTHCRPLILTPWERQALQLLADGHTTADMAASLGVSAPECETLLAALFAVMGAATQAEAIADADRRGLLMPATMKSAVLPWRRRFKASRRLSRSVSPPTDSVRPVCRWHSTDNCARSPQRD